MRTGGARQISPWQSVIGLAIWKYKGNDTRRGVVALGEVVEGPELRAERDSPYWIGQGGANLGETAPRVLVRYVRPPRRRSG